MAETTLAYDNGGDGEKKFSYSWTSLNVKHDLIHQAGLDAVLLRINITQQPSSYLAVYEGFYDGIRFKMRWKKDEFLIVKMEQRCPELIRAFSKVVGYESFAEYKFEDGQMKERLPFTVEWCKNHCDESYKALQTDEQKKDLKRL